ncbi:MAG: NAD+ kinase [Candidatus Marivariicella framensis]|jgi:NAD+ kinase|tara:strand:+ start:190 stop:1056 length:867 start_codon:yes stop_codon:yes gene_type:complete
MKVGIFRISSKSNSLTEHEIAVIEYLDKHNHEIFIDVDFFKSLALNKNKKPLDINKVDVLFTIGGDGTLLRAIPIVKDTKVPILGINTGQLGFLTSVNKESLIKGLDMFFMKKYTLIKRTLLELKTSPEISDIVFFPYALNEVTINRKNSTSMLSIKTTIDQKLLTTYWSDGLIISTSTGSTGYSLSSGGPIISPEANAFVLNPIAPHNIGMRPLIVPDKSNIGIHVTGRSKKHLISLDNRRFTIQNSSSISISKAPFFIKTIQLEGNDFFMTLRDKLFWGLDKRNRQ